MASAREAKVNSLITIDGFHGYVQDVAIDVRWYAPNRIRLTVGRSVPVHAMAWERVSAVQHIERNKWETRRFLVPFDYPIEIHAQPRKEAPDG